MFPFFLLYLIGFAPVLLARKWPARIVAILFGFVALGLNFYGMSSLHKKVMSGLLNIPHTSRADSWAQILSSPLIPLGIALISAVVTYSVDKESGVKVESAGESKRPQIRTRLYIGGLLLIPLFFTAEPLSRWSSVEGEVVWSFISGAVAVLPLVVLTPVLVRGSAWERVMAFALMFLPMLALVDAFVTAIRYR